MLRLTRLAAGVMCAAMCGPVMAADLMMTRADVTPLTDSDIGKPFWALQAQCAGVFGAAYRFESAHGKTDLANRDKIIGVAMLENAVARLQVDRGLDRPGAMALAEPEVEYGRGVAVPMLDQEGTRVDSQWNFLRSACLDIDAAARRHLAS